MALNKDDPIKGLLREASVELRVAVAVRAALRVWPLFLSRLEVQDRREQDAAAATLDNFIVATGWCLLSGAAWAVAPSLGLQEAARQASELFRRREHAGDTNTDAIYHAAESAASSGMDMVHVEVAVLKALQSFSSIATSFAESGSAGSEAASQAKRIMRGAIETDLHLAMPDVMARPLWHETGVPARLSTQRRLMDPAKWRHGFMPLARWYDAVLTGEQDTAWLERAALMPARQWRMGKSPMVFLMTI